MTSHPADEPKVPAAETPAPGTRSTPTTPAVPTEPFEAPPATTTAPTESVTKATRTSGTWIAVIVATILLIFLLVFILQNLATVTVSFLGLSGNLPLGVALLFAAIVGALVVILAGAARILQLRRRVHRAGSR
jgi:uncharacterized integral membrane protein